MQAFTEGKEIEYKRAADTEFGWKIATNPAWNWTLYEYRIKEKKVIKPVVPWELIQEQFKYYAVDIDKSGWFFTDSPFVDLGVWRTDEGDLMESVLNIPYKGDWKDSLVCREEVK